MPETPQLLDDLVMCICGKSMSYNEPLAKSQ